MFFSILGVFSGEDTNRKITSQQLYHGHLAGRSYIGSFSSFNAADEHAASLAKPQVERELERIKADAKRLGVK